MWDAFKDLIFLCLDALHNIVPSHDWGMAILIFTIIFRVILLPLMNKQIKSSFQMQKIQPKMQEIQTRYAGDQVRMQEETQKLYAEAKFNPLAGCLPMFLQMPIFMAMFQVLQEMTWRVGDTGYTFYNLVPDLRMTPAGSFEQGFLTAIPYLVLLIVFAGATFLPMVLQQMGNDGPQKKQTLIMSAFMTVFMLWIGWGSPAGVLLYWGMSSVIGVAYQQFAMARLKKKDRLAQEEAIEVEPIKVDVTRKEKKKRPTKKN